MAMMVARLHLRGIGDSLADVPNSALDFVPNERHGEGLVLL